MKRKNAKGQKATKRRTAARRQMDRDNVRVPRDWANDPAWLRDLLRRTWEALGDDMDYVFRIGEHQAGGLTHREFDLLSGQVLYVLSADLENRGSGDDGITAARLARGDA